MTHSVCDMTCHASDQTHMSRTGEVIGGLHGKNRLGGNALSECVVFGRVIGNRIAASLGARAQTHTPSEKGGGGGGSLGDAPAESPLVEVVGGVGSKEITKEEMGKHNSEASCWVSIDDKVCAYEYAHSCVRARARVRVRVRIARACAYAYACAYACACACAYAYACALQHTYLFSLGV